MPMMTRPRIQWNARDTAPQLVVVLRSMDDGHLFRRTEDNKRPRVGRPDKQPAPWKAVMQAGIAPSSPDCGAHCRGRAARRTSSRHLHARNGLCYKFGCLQI